MSLTSSEANDRIQQTEDERQGFRDMAKRAEKMWSLKPFTRSESEAFNEAQEQVITNDPYAVTHLAMRLINDKPLIHVPANEGNKESTGYKDIRQKWLRAAWQEINNVTGENVIRNATWQAFVLGRASLQVAWIKPRVPEKRRKTTFPILVRNLSPYNVGVHRGPYGVEHAYHKYETTLGYVVSEYPNARKTKVVRELINQTNDKEEWRNTKVEFTDFWYEDPKGQIWNGKMVDGTFIQKMEKSDYPEIPIIEIYGDTSMSSDPAMKSISLLFPMEKLWKYKCRAMSQMATGLLWYFWPFIYVMNDMGQIIPDREVRPGRTAQWPAGSKLEVVQIQPNMALSQAVMNYIDTSMQNAGFPNVMFGDAGDLQSGYGVNLLAQAAIGRVNQVRANLEAAITHVNEIMLGMVEKFADDDEGVTIYGYNVSTAKPFGETLLPRHMENGFHRNIVRLEPNMPEDDIQRITMAKTLADSGIISKRTVRDRFLRIPLPDDEENRIHLEMALTSDELKQKTMINALVAYTEEDWREFIAGSPLEDVIKRIEQEQALANSPQQPTPNLDLSPQMPTPASFLPPSPGSGLPLGPGAGAIPPGAVPMQPPASMVPPMGGGIPPQQQGQITPQQLAGTGIDPVMFAEMMGRPLPPFERDQALMGVPARRRG